MHVTSVNLPEDMIDSIDELVKTGNAVNRTQVILAALRNFIKLQMYRWRGSVIVLRGNRHGLVSKGTLERLVQVMTPEELHEAGFRAGVTLRESAFMEYRMDITKDENHKAALQMLEDAGWGNFTIDERGIMVEDSLVPSSLLHGYLERALSLKLQRSELSEGVTVYSRVAVEARTP